MNALFALALLQETTTTTDTSAVPSAAVAGMGIGMGLFLLAFGLLMLISVWKVYTKAGKPGWAAFVPIYGQIVLCEICGKPIWWILISPFLVFPLAAKFGKGTGFALGLLFLFPIFWPMLAFGSAKYQP